MPKVSVIIPVYNCESYIAGAVQSALDQHHHDIEVIVVDDGSSDNTVPTLAPYQDRICLIQQANAGVAAARNAGLRAARGDMVAFLDADDWWDPSRLSAQLAALICFPDAAMVFSDFSVANSDGATLMPRSGIRWKYGVVRDADTTPWQKIFGNSAIVHWEGTKNSEHEAIAYQGHIARWLFRGNFINTCSVLLHREVIDRIGEFDQTLDTEEDYDYWLRVASEWPLVYVDAPLTTFRVSPGQLTRPAQIERIVRNALQVVQRASVRMPADLDPEEVMSRFARMYLSLGVIALRTGRNIEARNHLKQSLRHRPWRTVTLTLALYVLTFLPSWVFAGALRVRARFK
jgi:glycosyltransferase involved in cell wall biosynthesis